MRDFPQPDGSIIFEAEVAGTDEIRLWIMTWGSNAEVLGAVLLKEENRDEVEGMLKGFIALSKSLNLPYLASAFSAVG